MSYHRVIPRDLFNEANLLKCYGQIYINLDYGYPAQLRFEPEGREPFVVVQNDDDGSLSLSNVWLEVRGKRVNLSRPLNSRDSYPLYLTTEEDDLVIQVFMENGEFTEEMENLLWGVTE